MFKPVTKLVVKSTVVGSDPVIEAVAEFATEEEAEIHMDYLACEVDPMSKVFLAVGLFEVTSSLITTEMYAPAGV